MMAVLGWIFGVIIVAFLGRLATNELFGLLEKGCRRIVKAAVDLLPEPMREEHRKEWLAVLDFEGKDGKKFSELRAAFGVLIGAWQTALILEEQLPAEERLERRYKRKTNRAITLVGVGMWIMLPQVYLNDRHSELYVTQWWPWPLFLATMGYGIFVILQLRSADRLGKELKKTLEASLEDK